MKKLLGILVLGLLWCNVGFAEWTLVGESTRDDKFYIDLKTIKKKSGNRYVWVLTDYKKPLEEYIKSAKQLLQIDCELDRFKMIEAITYTGHMGSGNLERLDLDNPKWIGVPPGTAWFSIINKVCKW